MHHRQLYSYPFSGNHLPDLEMTDPELYHIIKDEFPPKMHFVQHVYNNHRNARDAYLINYMDDGGRHFQDIVFTFEVNIDHLAAGSYAAELHLDPDNKKYDSGENYPVDIQEDIAFSSSDPDEDPEAPVNIAGLYFGEFVYYDQCFDSDPYPSSSQAATYVYRVNHQQWDEDEEWAHHLKSFEENGVDDDTADEMAIGEVWGPFGAGCHQYAGDHIHARLGCDTWAYNSSTEITCDAKEADPSAPCFNYANNYCDPDDSTEDYEECIGKLNHFPGRPNPRDIKNVIMFFPGVLGANGGSGMTGQRAYHATQDDFQDVGDNKIMCPFRTDSLMGRIVAGRYIFDGNMVNCPYDQYQCGYANCGTCYSPENTLLVGVWDSAIDTTETQDLQILNGFEEMIALRTNMYENVERVWIVGGSRGGSTAIYLGSRIVERFKGEYSPRLPAAGLGGPTYNRIINHNLDEFGNHRDASDLKFVIAGFSPQSMTNDPDEVKHWQRVVSHPWGYHDPPDPGNRACHDCADGPDGSGSHGNGHDFVDMYSQSGEHIWSNGTTGQPTLAVISIEDDSGYDPMFHVRCDDADCENDAELGVHRDWPYCVWYWDWDGDGHDHGYPADNRCGIRDAGVPLSYAWPFEGPDGGDAGNFFTMLFPLKNDYSADGGWRRYEHNEMTREWTLFHNAVANYMFDKLFPGVAFDGGDPDLPVEALCYYEPGIEWSCWNRIDDDGDALVDLDDPDCEWTHEGYSEETCSDGIDQDEDGDIDCEDTGCCDQDICTDPYSMCRGLADCIYDCYMMCCGGSECDPCYDTCAAGCYLY
jgi:hypothetical protein